MEMSLAEFHVTHFKIDGKLPTVTKAQLELFDIMEEAERTGKQIMIGKRRPQDFDAYNHSLLLIAYDLTHGKTICLISTQAQITIADLKARFGIECTTEPLMKRGVVVKDAVNLKKKS